MKVYEVYEPDGAPGEATSTYKRTETQARSYADPLRDKDRRFGVYECELAAPSGRVEERFALLNGLRPVRGDLLYGRDWANRRVEHPPADDLASPPNAYRDDKLHDEFYDETGMYAPADPRYTGDLEVRRAQWDAWLLLRRAARVAGAAGGAG